MAKTGHIPNGHRKDEIRAALIESAREGHVIHYGELAKRLGMFPRGPWKAVLAEITREEVAAGRPDVTQVLVAKETGYSHQIDFEDAHEPTDAQKARADEMMKATFAFYARAKNED